MARIFISYRREDSEIWAARLEESLKREFAAEQVFRDVTAIAPGVDFVAALEAALGETAAAIVMIGPSWLSLTDRKGGVRLEQPADFVRQEVAACLARKEVRVFPVLVDGAEMPGEDDLPQPLKPLWRRNALPLTVRHWDHDVAQLVQRLKEVPGLLATRAPSTPQPEGSPAHPPSATPSPPARPRRRWLAISATVAAGIAVAVALGIGLADRSQKVPAPAGPPATRVLLRGQDGSFGSSDALRELATIIRSTSDGSVTMEVLPAGAAVKPGELPEAVANGTLDFAWVLPALFSAKDRAFALVDSPPFGPAPEGYLRWRTDPAVMPIIDELYARQGVRAFPCGVIWMADLWTNQPLRNASDLRGRKIRASASLRPEIFKRAGATHIALPGGELVAAMERGVAGTVQHRDLASGVELKLHEFARAVYFPGRLVPAAGLDLVVNPAMWNALEPAARRAIEQACGRNARQMLVAGGEAQRNAVSQIALRGVTVEELPRDVEDELRRAWRELAAELNADPMFRRLNATLSGYPTGGR